MRATAFCDGLAPKYTHLHNWQVSLWDQAPRRRREIYRVFASKIARTYGKVLVDDFSLQHRPHCSQAAYRDQQTKPFGSRLRTIAAPGQLLFIVSQTCEREGVLVQPIAVRGESRTCPHCAFEYAETTHALVLHCSRCGGESDQDHQRAMQMLSSGFSFGA